MALHNQLRLIRSQLSSKLYEINLPINELINNYEINKKLVNINILKSPNDYYEQIINEIKNVNSNITLSALYFGSTLKEKHIVNELDNALSDVSRPNLQVNIILDYTRASRRSRLNNSNNNTPNSNIPNNNSSIDILSRLVNKYNHRCRIFLYRMPPLSISNYIPNFMKSFINVNYLDSLLKHFPSEMIETIGVYHCKYCIFDNTVILTGANLSEEYFVNRQDRYIAIKSNSCNQLISFLYDFTDIVKLHSYELSHNLVLNPPVNSDDKQLHNKLSDLVNPNSKYDSSSNDIKYNTSLYPLIQHNPIKLTSEMTGLMYLFTVIKSNYEYFNNIKSVVISSPYPSYTKFLLDLFSNIQTIKFIFPSKSSHGFSKGGGIKSIIPLMHMKAFYDSIIYLVNNISSKPFDVNLYAFNKSDWTFHSKGLWIESMKTSTDSTVDITYIGSSNLGERSWKRDFELGFILITSNNAIQNELKLEYNHIIENCKQIEIADINKSNSNNNTLLSFIVYLFRSYL